MRRELQRIAGWRPDARSAEGHTGVGRRVRIGEAGDGEGAGALPVDHGAFLCPLVRRRRPAAGQHHRVANDEGRRGAADAGFGWGSWGTQRGTVHIKHS